MKYLLLILIIFTTTHAQYNRSEWRHWIDEDKDMLNTRQEVLLEENIADTLYLIKVKNKIRIVHGKWICPYTGDTITNPKYLDVDHFIPLKHAYENGGNEWSKSQKKAYANFLEDKSHLVAVKASANRSKGSKGPLEWMPEKNKCWYLKTWIKIKEKWNLKFSPEEAMGIISMSEKYCKG
jgi:5-methylcytosine-specific restriction endonuclease McrA